MSPKAGIGIPKMRKLVGMVLCAIGPLWVVLSLVQDWLMKAGILNKKDLPPFVGSENGTASEYLLNVWHWDGLLLLLLVATLPSLVIGIRLVRRGRLQPDDGKAEATP